MTSDTVSGPRELPAPLRSRLDEIAGRHGGRVPLHSRLFAQWMHYAFPNECPYPRSLLTTEAELPQQEWMEMYNATTGRATLEEMQAATYLLDGDNATAGEDPVQLWSEDEELLSDLVGAPGHGPMASLHWLVCTAALAASASVIKKVADSTWGERGNNRGKKPCLDSVQRTKESRTHLV
jgi:hypothetical protein